MNARAFISGVSGQTLTADERAFLREQQPWGFILFKRNVDSPAQVRDLVASLRDCIGSPDAPVLIDQEGGRVQRLGPPHWPKYPPGAAYLKATNDPAAARELVRLGARLIAHDLRELGITVDCVPVLDVPVPGAHDIIGDRAYGRTVEQVVALARAVGEGFMAGGVLPVIKHIPGHGRATADSHLALPVVTETRAELAATDFAPFKALSGMPAAMTAHVVFRDIDPDAPASISPTVTREIIRDAIGFDGLLMSDDLTMKALTGPMRQRAEAVIAAGSDLVLHCNGDLAEMAEAAAGAGALAGKAEARFDAAFGVTKAVQPFDSAAAEAQLAKVLALAAAGTESV